MKLALISCVVTALAALSLNAEAARFVRFEVNGTTSYGEVVGDKIHQLSGLFSMRQNEQGFLTIMTR